LASLPEPRDIYQDIRDVMNTQGITGQSKAVREARLAWFTAHTNFTAPADDSPPTAETWGALVEAARAYREATPDPPKGKRTAKAEPEPKLCRIVLDDDLTRRNQQSKDWRQCGKPVVFASFCDEHKTTPAVEPDPFMVRK